MSIIILKRHTDRSVNLRNLANTGACSRVVYYSEASNVVYAGYEVGTVNGVAHWAWDPGEMKKSSTWRELCVVYRVLQSLVHVL